MQLELKVEERASRGKGPARRARAQKKIPAVFYGPHQKDAICLSLDAHEFQLVRNKATINTVYKLLGGKVDGKMALLKSAQLNPITSVCEHVDFYEVREGEPMRVRVPVVLTGKSAGQAEGGLIQQITRVIPIQCLPKNIPQNIEVDITALGLNQSLHVADITLPEGVSVAGGVNYTLVACVPPEADKKSATAEAAAPATAAPAKADAKAGEAKK